MTNDLPRQYRWLYDENGPRILLAAIDQYGVSEIVGEKNNPIILEWAHWVGKKIGVTVKDDEMPWCGTFMAYCAKSAGYEPPPFAIRARSWLGWGVPQSHAELGDVLIFAREGGGHVGLYVGEDEGYYHVLGGNQRNMVSIIRISKYRCIGIRRCPWKIAQPKNIRKIILTAHGDISKNEA